MTAFAGPDAMPGSIPKQTGLTETGSGGYDAAIAFGPMSSVLDHSEIVCGKTRNTVGISLKVVEHADMGNSKCERDFMGIHTPREVCWLGSAIQDNAGNSKTCSEDWRGVTSKKFAKNGVEIGVLGAGEALIPKKREFVPDDAEERNICLRASDIAGKDEVGLVGHYLLRK